MWTCTHGLYSISLVDGHRTISPGVRRQVDTAIDQCQKNCK